MSSLAIKHLWRFYRLADEPGNHFAVKRRCLTSIGQGFILKATASTYAQRVSAGDREAGSGRVPSRCGSTFNGKRVANRQPHKGSAATPDYGKEMEDAFWQNKQLPRRIIIPADVLTAYGKDASSIRSGFFLQKLCLQSVLAGNKKVTPDQVIQEFNRKPDQNNKYQLAIARFKEKCCLKGLALRGQQVTPDAVVKDFQAIKAVLELARFKADCCLKGVVLHGQPVTAGEVVKDFQAAKATLELARFKEECCLKGLALHGRRVTADEVVKALQAAKAPLELARFQGDCCLRGLLLNGQPVTPDAVVKDYQAINATLELARFKTECCLKGLALNGQPVLPDAVVKDYQAAKATVGLARFKAECCLKGMALNGQPVTPDEVIKDFQVLKASLELARFKEECCLRGLSLNGRPVPPGEVVKDFQAINATLELALFLEQCCLGGLALNGQPVTPDAVVKSYQVARAALELARFKSECCLRGLVLNGQQVPPDEVVKDYRAVNATLELARLLEQCCLRGLPLNGQPITVDVVVESFPDSPRGQLGMAHFKAECCLRGLPLNGQQIPPDEVVKDFPASVEGRLAIGRFKEGCCLKGLSLNGRPVPPDAVVKDFQITGAILEIARFKEACCLKGLALNGQLVPPDAVVKDYQAARAILEIARFKMECCLRGLRLNGKLIPPDEVVEDFQVARATLELTRFKEQCCLRGLLVNGQPVTPDAVVKNYQAVKATLELARFKEQCCLRGLALNGQPVTPESVVNGYERGGWLLERAFFYAQLALNARELNGSYLDNQKVLAAFNDVPGDQSLKQTEYLIQRLQQSRQFDETDQAQDELQEAWQILNGLLVKGDEQHRLQCLLKFMAMRNELTIDHQRVSAEHVLQSIKTLRCSFKSSRLHFFFLAHCYITGQSINGRKIHKSYVLNHLQSFPEGSRFRHALGYWFGQCSSEANLMDNLLFKREGAVAPGAVAPGAVAPGAVTSSLAITLLPWLTTGRTDFPDKQVPYLSALTLKTLEIIQEVNDAYTNPPILITGSYARFLQNLCSFFNDIDIICTTEKSARTLFDKLKAMNTDRYAEIPQSLTIRPIPGCQAIKLPNAYNIHLKGGDLGTGAKVIQVNIDDRVTHENSGQLAFHVPGVKVPVRCLSFAEETRLLNNTLEHLADHLDLLTGQLQTGPVFYIPRTLLFNAPQTPDERIYGLLMRSLLTLNKARQFIALHSERKTAQPDYPINPLQEQQRLHALVEKIQMKLHSHAYRHDFELRVNNWLSTTLHVNDYEIKRKEFIKTLLAMMHPE